MAQDAEARGGRMKWHFQTTSLSDIRGKLVETIGDLANSGNRFHAIVVEFSDGMVLDINRTLSDFRSKEVKREDGELERRGFSYNVTVGSDFIAINIPPPGEAELIYPLSQIRSIRSLLHR